MRALLPAPIGDVDVHAYYADGWVDVGGVRANFVASADGAAHASGVSKGLQTPGDNTVFAALRDLADVVLVGSGTAVAEKYGPVTFSARRAALRREYGLRATVPVAVISRTLRLDPGSALFTDADPSSRTIVLTCGAADADTARTLGRVADVVTCGDDTVDSGLARAALHERGLTRILSEGGPSVFNDLASAGVVDELCLSVSPLLVGGGPGRIIGGPEWPEPAGLTLVGLLEEDGALFHRYAVTGRPGRP